MTITAGIFGKVFLSLNNQNVDVSGTTPARGEIRETYRPAEYVERVGEQVSLQGGDTKIKVEPEVVSSVRPRSKSDTCMFYFEARKC